MKVFKKQIISCIALVCDHSCTIFDQEIDDDQSEDEELKLDRNRLSCDRCRRKFKNEVILEYHKVRCSSKWQSDKVSMKVDWRQKGENCPCQEASQGGATRG